MKVKEARHHVDRINEIIDQAMQFEIKHEDLGDETCFVSDAINYLSDYRKHLEEAIENAEL